MRLCRRAVIVVALMLAACTGEGAQEQIPENMGTVEVLPTALLGE